MIISDDMEMKAIASHYGLAQAIPLALEAGIDVLCLGNNLSYDPQIAEKAATIIVRAVESGRLSPERIATACARVLALKRQVIGGA